MLSRVLWQNTSRRVAQRFFFSTLTQVGSPSVKDLLINLTIVDPDGARKSIKGFIGKTLYEACESHDIRLGPDSSGGPYQERRSPTWVETTFGESVTTGYDHVVLTGKGANTVEPPDELELQALDDFWDPDYIFEGSRLASCITLNREMDGMVVYVGERLEHDFF